MKSVITYLILFTFILGASGKALILLNFYINQDYIAQNLCENREKPQLECNGKCHLAKELAKEEKKEKQEEKQQFKDTSVYYFSPVEEVYTCVFILVQEKENFSNVIEQKPSGYSSSIFHPPTFA